MFPIKDTTPNRTIPFVNYVLIFINLYIFYLQMTAANFEDFTFKWAFIPSQFQFMNPQGYLYIFTSIFMHGGIIHLLSNMWFLHLFGDNVEDVLGHFPYLIFYLVGGFFATMGQYFIASDISLPLIGASGAISAVAGAYLVLFRQSKVKTLVPIFFGLFDIIELPVWLFLGYWFFIQVFSGLGSLVDISNGGVAFFAHIAGFVFGFLMASTIKRQSGIISQS